MSCLIHARKEVQLLHKVQEAWLDPSLAVPGRYGEKEKDFGERAKQARHYIVRQTSFL